MQQKFTAKLTQITITVACASMLAACGGGGGSSDNAAASNNSSNNTGTQSDVSAGASQAISLDAQKQGLTKDDNTFAMTLSIGDTWSLKLDPGSLTYTMTVIQTAGVQGLQNGSTHTGTYTVNGDVLKDTNGAWTLKISATTQTITGEISRFNGTPIVVSGQTITTQASGTLYKAPADLSRFKGTYFVTGAMRNAKDNKFSWNYMGQLRIANDGKTASLCANGIFNSAGKCEAGDTGEDVGEGTFDLAQDEKTGLIRVSNTATGDQGLVNFQLSELGGYTLIHDRLGKNEEGILRTGIMYGSLIPNLQAGDVEGDFQCKNSFTGKSIATVKVTGATASIKSPDYSATETLEFNQFRRSNGSIVKVPGIAESIPQGKPNEGAIFHPISKDQFMTEAEGSSYGFNICTRI